MTFADGTAHDSYHRGLAIAAAEEAPPDIRSLHLRVALLAEDVELARRWAEEIATCRDGDVLKNSRFEVGAPHLWAHIQEGALAWASTVLDDPSLLEVAARSAEAVVVPAIRDRFTATPRSVAYDVSSCVWSLDRLADATADAQWAELAAEGRAWFDGHNAAGMPVYDPVAGRVADGIDHDLVSENSGAESNIVTAEVLLDEAVASARAMADPFAP